MEEREGNWLGSAIAWPSVFAIFLIVVGFSVRPPRIDSPRPQQATQSQEKDLSIHARLWEDPLEAVEKVRETTSTIENITNAINNFQKDCITYLGVCITGRMYADDRETRLRTRYAVSSALARYGYVPVNNEQIQWIGLYDLDIANRLINEPTKEVILDFIIPFEKYRLLKKPDNRKTNICVFWINNEYLKQESILSDLSKFCNLVKIPEKKIKIVGPIDSTRLIKMFVESSNNPPKTVPSKLINDATIYSPWATISYPITINQSSKDDRYVTLFSEQNKSFQFIRTIGSDEQLMSSLVDELDFRHSNPIHRSSGIVLISEWDTDYGRALPDTFIRVVQQRNTEIQSLTESNAQPENIKVFHYLKGVDGELPVPKGSENAVKKESGEQKGFRSFPKPEGNPQLDYVFRLVDRINGIKYDWSREKEKIKLKAIGVLGSDIYDKLLILRTLRDHFPEAIFFTTDLDALYCHPGEREWTQNLIVSSFFGLQLSDQYQGAIPPFRDVYQTSVFYSCLYALEDCAHEKLTFQNISALSPRIYEIGRTSAYDLTGITAKWDPRPASQRNQSWIFQPSRLVLLFLSLILILVVIYFYYDSWQKYVLSFMQLERGNVIVTMVTGFIILFVLVMIYLSHQSVSEEPFTLFEGISIWPTELIRLFITFYCLYAIAKGYENIKKCEINIADRKEIDKKSFHEWISTYWIEKSTSGNTETDTSYESSSEEKNNIDDDNIPLSETKGYKYVSHKVHSAINFILYHIRLFSKDFFSAWRYKMTDSEIEEAINILNKNGKLQEKNEIVPYLKLFFFSNGPSRFIRVITLSILFLLFAILIFANFSHPIKPLRGDLSWYGDTIAIRFCVFSLILLLLFNMDSTWICEKYVRELFPWKEEVKNSGSDNPILDNQYAIRVWGKIENIESITEKVSQLIYNPFIALFLLILSRHKIFDRWDWPVSLIIVLGAFFLGAIFFTINLRRIVEKARSRSLRNLDNASIEYKKKLTTKLNKEDVEKYRSTIDLIDTIRQKIVNLNTGAFASFTQNPVLRALLIPFGGMGTLNLLEYLIKF